ncbi:MAG TPA: hypothetical protein VFI31_18645 [Pirellulales bacterium]|nr:hypothetical protein [Pirellulales bacterium]
MAPSHGDLLPVPPAESATYDADADYSMTRPSRHRPASTKTSVKKQHYSMPQVHSASKTTPKTKKKKEIAAPR